MFMSLKISIFFQCDATSSHLVLIQSLHWRYAAFSMTQMGILNVVTGMDITEGEAASGKVTTLAHVKNVPPFSRDASKVHRNRILF